MAPAPQTLNPRPSPPSPRPYTPRVEPHTLSPEPQTWSPPPQVSRLRFRSWRWPLWACSWACSLPALRWAPWWARAPPCCTNTSGQLTTHSCSQLTAHSPQPGLLRRQPPTPDLRPQHSLA